MTELGVDNCIILFGMEGFWWGHMSFKDLESGFSVPFFGPFGKLGINWLLDMETCMFNG